MQMIRDLEPFSADWLFCGAQTDPDPSVVASGVAVHLPHNAEDLPLNYFDERAYQQTYLYQRTLAWRDDFADKEVSLVFDGAMADARVYLNGTEIAAQKDGYTPFEVRLTGLLLDGDNLISVVLSGVENPDIPPFGGQIDYLTYAGLYREVWLKIVPDRLHRLRQDRAGRRAFPRKIRGHRRSVPKRTGCGHRRHDDRHDHGQRRHGRGTR